MAAAVSGGLVGALLTRGLMRVIMIVADGDRSFTWSGSAFIALFYVLFLVPGAVALAWSRARWPLVVFGAGAIAIPVQAIGIATTDLEGLGPFTAGQWAGLAASFVAMAAVYVLQAAFAYRVATSGRRDRQGEPSATFVGAGGRETLG
ncbi:hypothetical protein [Blastococcus aurantiacus]|uniref:hypothetical protein n=1 Tax=Blastococcus aurantiacus TaxID=1550231 RepID=UPI000B80D315|nr:hypothetical protein [Blastococcus aurantiacus]